MTPARPGLWLLPLLVAAACRQAPPPAASTSAPPALPSPLPDVVARVNGQPIKARLLEFVANEGRQLEQLPAEKRPEVYRKTLNKLIERELLFQEALARGVRPEDRAVEAGYDQLRSQFPSQEAWQASLARQGLDEAGFRLEVRARMTIQALINEEGARQPAVTEAEARAYYDAHPAELDTGERCRVRHILIRSPQGSDPAAARARAEAALARLRKGEDFAKVARQASEDPSSASRGGELPELRRAELDPKLAEAIFGLKPGETSDVIVTPYGLAIVRMLERLPSRHLGFEEARAGLQQRLEGERRRQAVSRLIEALRAKASIETAF